MNIEATGTELRVCQLIAERQQKGIHKYGCTVASNPLSLRQWLQHALEENLDQAVYLKRSLEELDAIVGPAAERPARTLAALEQTVERGEFKAGGAD